MIGPKVRVKYKCNKCGLSCTLGAMESIPEYTSITQIVDLIEDSHKIHSPDCTDLSVNSITLELDLKRARDHTRHLDRTGE